MPSYTDNRLLSTLQPRAFEALRPHLKSANFRQADILHRSGEQITDVYFPFDAVISLIVVLGNGARVEAAMVGRDGAVGAATALHGKRSFNRAIVQVSGSGVICNLDTFAHVATEYPAIRSAVIGLEQIISAQAQQTAACNIFHDTTARLCRGILRARDLSGSDTLPFTQETLAEMMGVRRTTVSTIAHTLQASGMIHYRRGKIRVLDIEAMQERACECYGTVKDHYDKLLRHNVLQAL